MTNHVIGVIRGPLQSFGVGIQLPHSFQLLEPNYGR